MSTATFPPKYRQPKGTPWSRPGEVVSPLRYRTRHFSRSFEQKYGALGVDFDTYDYLFFYDTNAYRGPNFRLSFFEFTDIYPSLLRYAKIALDAQIGKLGSVFFGREHIASLYLKFLVKCFDADYDNNNILNTGRGKFFVKNQPVTIAEVQNEMRRIFGERVREALWRSQKVEKDWVKVLEAKNLSLQLMSMLSPKEATIAVNTRRYTQAAYDTMLLHESLMQRREQLLTTSHWQYQVLKNRAKDMHKDIQDLEEEDTEGLEVGFFSPYDIRHGVHDEELLADSDWIELDSEAQYLQAPDSEAGITDDEGYDEMVEKELDAKEAAEKAIPRHFREYPLVDRAGIPRGKFLGDKRTLVSMRHRAATETEDEESDEGDIGAGLDSMHIDSPDSLDVSQQPMAAPTTVQGGEVGSAGRGCSRFKPRREAFNRRRPGPKDKSLSAQYNTSSPGADSSPKTYPPIPNTEETDKKHEDITSHSTAFAESALHVTASPTPRDISSPSLVSTSMIATTNPFPAPVPVTSAPLTCSVTHQTPPASSAVGSSSPATRLPSITDSMNTISNRLSRTELDESSTIVNNQLVHEFVQFCSLGKRDAPDDVCDPARPDAKRRRL